MILLTDGVGSGGISEAETAAERNTTIYTIGFDNADEDKLQEIANITGGEYNYVADSSNLPNVFSRVANNTTEITDSDGDGLSDELETDGIVLGGPGMGTVTTNATATDTDGDGLTDSEEVGQFRTQTGYLRNQDRHYSVSYHNANSDPMETDTDVDGLTDYEETEEGFEIRFG
jgi:hypothetical protein